MLPTKVWDRLALLVETADGFHGDERDIIIFTVTGVHEGDRRERTVDADIDADFRRNGSFGVAGWRHGQRE